MNYFLNIVMGKQKIINSFFSSVFYIFHDFFLLCTNYDKSSFNRLLNTRLIVFPKTKMKKNQLFYFITIRGPSNYGGQRSYLDFTGFEHLNFIVFIWECCTETTNYQWLKYQTLSEWEHMIFWIIGHNFRSFKTCCLENMNIRQLFIVLSKWFY